MNTSETTAEIFGALATAQAAFKTIPKGREAKIPTKSGGEYSYNYADLADVVEAIKPHLAKSDLAVLQTPERRSVMVHDGRDDDRPTQVESHDVMTTRIVHKSGEWIEGSMKVTLAGGAQDLGSSITYARRYHLAAMLGLVTDADDDGALAQAAYGDEAATRGSRTRRAPKTSTSTRGSGGRSAASEDGSSTGGTAMAAKDRNTLVAHFARKLSPPVTDIDEVLKRVNTILGKDGPVDGLPKLSAAQGAKLFRELGVGK